MRLTVFSLLELFFSCYIVVALAKENLLETRAIVFCFATSEARICLTICEFLWLLTNRNSGLLLLCTELTENCVYLNQSELSNFFMYIIRNSNEPRSWSWGKIEELKSSPIIKLYGPKKVVIKNKFSLSPPLSPLSPPLSSPLPPSLSPLSPPSLPLSPPLSPLSLPSLPLSPPLS